VVAYILGALGYIWYPLKERSRRMINGAAMHMNPYQNPSYSTF
jgi:hypothetical protein